MADRKRDDPWAGEPASTVIPLLCLVRGWSRARLAQEADVDPSQLSRYESGETTPRPDKKRRLLAAARVPFSVVVDLSARLRLIREATAGEPARVPLRNALPSGAEAALELTARELAALWEWRSEPQAAEGDPDRVERLWRRFQSLAPGIRQPLLEASRAHQSWRFLVRLCEESESLASHQPDEALELARLAIHAARQGQKPADKAWRARLQGYVSAFEANAYRVAGNLKAAERAFVDAWRLWKEGADPLGRLSEARLLDLEASLLRDQGRFVAALARLEAAQLLAAPGEAGRLLLKKSAVLEGNGDYEGSLTALDEAAGAIDAEREPRLFFGLRYNQGTNLCRLRRAESAAQLLPEIRRLAEQLHNDIDLLKADWLTAAVAVGLGRTAEAEAGLEQVCRAFRERGLACDFALAGLDLALLYREQGRWSEIQRLAREMVEIFEQQAIHREAAAALVLFQEAAVKEAVTVELVRRLQGDLKRAQRRPGLRFVAGAGGRQKAETAE